MKKRFSNLIKIIFIIIIVVIIFGRITQTLTDISITKSIMFWKYKIMNWFIIKIILYRMVKYSNQCFNCFRKVYRKKFETMTTKLWISYILHDIIMNYLQMLHHHHQYNLTHVLLLVLKIHINNHCPLYHKLRKNILHLQQ